MAVRMFAAIDVGSFEIAMKVFEISTKGVREIDHVRHRIELGSDTFSSGKISYERMEELCQILSGFSKVMDTYDVKEYRALATSALRETENTRIILDQIKLKTGLDVKVISNSEQRFLSYKSVALVSDTFERCLKEGAAFLDIGGGSVQVSLFMDSHLVVTQNLNLGVLRIRDQLAKLAPKTNHYEQLIEELIDNELHILRKMYLKDMNIANIIVVDDYISYILNRISTGINMNMVTGEQFVEAVEALKKKPLNQFAKEVGLPRENASLLLPSAILIKHFVDSTGARLLWMPGGSLSDGIAYDYAQEIKCLKAEHDFEADIISSADNICKRFRSSRSRGKSLVQVSLAVFDAMKKTHGLSKRQRLLLQLAAMLRDCGKYVSAQAASECTYQIIMATEIIGLSHAEREIVANTAKNSYMKGGFYDEIMNGSTLDSKSYLCVAKLSAILQLSTGLARSKKKVLRSVAATVKGQTLVISVDSDADLTLEVGLFDVRSSFFEEVFGIRPQIKIRNSRREVK